MTHPIVSYLQRGLADLADADKAAKMQAYMKTEQPFFGVQATPRRELFREAKGKHPVESRRDYKAVVFILWRGDYREENYLALDVAETTRKFHDRVSWPIYEELVQTAPWWDTLDWIAGKIVGPLILKERELEADLIRWRTSDNMWVRRASLLAHLKHKSQTNVDLLSETILLLAHEDEFFIRKAIGWVLREYAKSDADWVRDFVTSHEAALAPLSKREALKNIG